MALAGLLVVIMVLAVREGDLDSTGTPAEQPAGDGLVLDGLHGVHQVPTQRAHHRGLELPAKTWRGVQRERL